MEFPSTLSPAAVESLEKVLPARPVTEFDGEEEESMLEVSFSFVHTLVLYRTTSCGFLVVFGEASGGEGEA